MPAIALRTWPAIVAASLALAAGCGEGEETTASTTTLTTTSAATTEAQSVAQDDAGEGQVVVEPKPLVVREVIEVVLTGSADARVICDRLATENYVRTAYGAREGCIAAQQPGALADSLAEVAVEIKGDRASATVVPAGGPYDGIEVEVELVRDGDGWRVDSLLADLPAGP